MSTMVARPLVLGVLLLALLACEPQAEPESQLLYQVNAGGPAVGDWSADTQASPSPWVDASGSNNAVFSTTSAIDLSHPSVPPGTSAALFQDERWDPPTGHEMTWNFPVPAGGVQVRLYLAEIDPSVLAGDRVFDIRIENQLVVNDLDVFAAVGADRGLVLTWRVPSDGNLDIDFGRVVGNPQVGAIRVAAMTDRAPTLAATPTSVSFPDQTVGTTGASTVTLRNTGAPGAPAITITGAQITGTGAAAFDHDLVVPTVLGPGAQQTVHVEFAPTVAGVAQASLQIAHDGSGSPLAVPLSGTGVDTPAPPPAPVGAQPTSLALGSVPVGSTKTATVDVINQAPSGGPSVHLTGTTVTGDSSFTDDFPDGTTVTLAPGASHRIAVRFAPTVIGTRSAILAVAHDGANPPLTIPLTGTGTQPGGTAPSFGKGLLSGTSSDAPTTLQFGPDGRLYVGQYDGTIVVYDVARAGANDYRVTATERINVVNGIPNHNDDGSLNTTYRTRLVTGILVTGTASVPVIYVNSSDPRIGGGGNGTDTGLDTNSGVISRLTRSGSSWTRTDLVRGLPRSENVHQGNGLALDRVTNTLFLAQGGNTNKGAPSNNFARLPEYALSGAILSIDLDVIGSTTYDLPTLDDETRPGTIDANDPFGGNNGRNQAKLVPGGPVQIYSPGYRNPYDLALTSKGELYTIDNGPNAAWGGIPLGEGPGGTCTNAIVDGGTSENDSLMHIDGPGFYGGHPNPTRGNRANTFNPTNPQSPVPTANPVECDFRNPTERGALTRFGQSTDGLVEYTASNFGGALRGDLLAVSYANAIHRMKLDATGDRVVLADTLVSSVGIIPLDLTAQGDAGPFPGTIWVADYVGDSIVVFEPADTAPPCTGADDSSLDEDGDGFDNADEIANGTDPCSAADTPPDVDRDLQSDQLDPDDDDDGIADTTDRFAVDPLNGLGTHLPISYPWDNGSPPAGGLLGLGFTGLMTNGVDDYADLFDPSTLTAGGAAGMFTLDAVGNGTAAGTANTQHEAFQFGVDVRAETAPFTVRTVVATPFAGSVPQAGQEMGVFVGTGDQDHYLQLVLRGDGGGSLAVHHENGGGRVLRATSSLPVPGPDTVELLLTVDPVAATVQAAVNVDGTGVRNIGTPVAIPTAWVDGAALAVGVIATSAGPAPSFPATWDGIFIGGALAATSSPTAEVSATDSAVQTAATDGDTDATALGTEPPPVVPSERLRTLARW